MSKLTRRLLSSIDFKGVADRRRENFQRLSQALSKYNEYAWSVKAVTVPLCYPLVLKHDVAGIRKKLASRGAFVPTYWENVRHRVRDTGIEATLLSRCLLLPCDQRCTDLQI